MTGQHRRRKMARAALEKCVSWLEELILLTDNAAQEARLDVRFETRMGGRSGCKYLKVAPLDVITYQEKTKIYRRRKRPASSPERNGSTHAKPCP